MVRRAQPLLPLFDTWALGVPLQVPDFNDMYELYDPCTVMFFFRNKHIMIDLGTGNNNKISWAFNNKQEVRGGGGGGGGGSASVPCPPPGLLP